MEKLTNVFVIPIAMKYSKQTKNVSQIKHYRTPTVLLRNNCFIIYYCSTALNNNNDYFYDLIIRL